MNPTPDISHRRRGLLAGAALATLLGIVAMPAAHADSRLVQVDVVDRDLGQTLHVWRDHGRPVVAGRPGDRYALRLVNNSGERVLAVVAIDGVNVISGETAAVGQRGYVLGPWERAEIKGWRKSESEVAAFEFTSLADAYAARTGRPLDVGVIGVAVFREAPPLEVSDARPVLRFDAPAPAPAVPAPAPAPAPMSPAMAAPSFGAPPAPGSRRAEAPDAAALSDKSAAAGSAAPLARDRLGTGHGARETDYLRIVSFQRASAQPDQRLEIRYDSVENLAAAGILPPPRVASTAPRSFPADRDYVPDPPLR